MPSFRDLNEALSNDLIGGDTGDVFVLIRNRSAGNFDDAGNRIQRGAFPCAVPADQRDDFAAINGQRDSLKRVDRAVIDVEVSNLKVHYASRFPCFFRCAYFTTRLSVLDPRYASMTRWSLRMTSGVPSAIFSPWSRTTIWSAVDRKSVV